MLYDHTLWNPPGYACGTCQVPEALPTGYTRLFPPPEVLDNVQNLSRESHPPKRPKRPARTCQVGKLQLTAQQEQDFVNFLSTLSNGFAKPNPVSE